VLSPHFILASSSPRRQELLATAGVEFSCQPADIDESVHVGEAPDTYVQRMARDKAAVVSARQVDASYRVLAADTSVIIDGEILGKPADYGEAMAFLMRLSGRQHRVITALCLQTEAGVTMRSEETTVQFMQLRRQQCEAYLATDEPWDKAGAYAIQGLGGAFVERIEGSYSNVVGLPLAQTLELLAEYGVLSALDGPPG
jgi:septum formation protein